MKEINSLKTVLMEKKKAGEWNGTHNVAKLWKNGIKTNLTDGESTASGVFVK